MKQFLVLLAPLLLALSSCQSDLPVYYPVPEFSLTERSGRTLTQRDLDGHVWVADFVFTNCAGTCPLITQQMRSLQDILPSEVRFVSFTVDPERDTPEVLEQYARQQGADPDRWFFLTGRKDVLHRISVEGFKLALDETTGTDVEPITHSTRFVLVDKSGQIRGYYGGTDDDEIRRLTGDIEKLL